MSDDQNCPDCGAWWEDHGYEHLARYCYPPQIERLETKLAAERQRADDLADALNTAANAYKRLFDRTKRIERALLVATEDEDALCSCECACRGHHLNYCQLMRIEKALGHGLAALDSTKGDE